MEKKRSPWSLIALGLGLLLLAVVIVVFFATLGSGAALALLFGGVFALAGLVMLIAGAVAFGVQASR